jgi:phosphoglycolate phosphatase-like HAD superfamily hydrolase
MDYQQELRSLKPGHDIFIGIDSDGCVFDSMEIKQKEFFIPNALKYFDLFPIAKPLRETWEFVNLYSVYRGVNRFPALIKVFDLLGEREEVMDSGCKLPAIESLRVWVKNETKLSNSSLRRYFESTGDIDIEKILVWSEAVNREIAEWLHDIPPFPFARKTIEKISGIADSIVVSQTPLEALEREWEEHKMNIVVRFIAAQEHGTKAEHIALAAKGKYPDDKIMLIGDAFGDLKAAQDNGVLFFPVIPGKEAASWEKLSGEGLDRFIKSTYKGWYEESLLREFKKSLPDTPPWKVNG